MVEGSINPGLVHKVLKAMDPKQRAIMIREWLRSHMKEHAAIVDTIGDGDKTGEMDEEEGVDDNDGR